MTMLIAFLFLTIKTGTPLLFGTVGEIMSQRVGHLNLGVEGMMSIGAVMGFYVGYRTGSVSLAILFAFIAGAFGALIYAVLTVTLMANQNVTGLTLTIFGTGFANFFGEYMIRKSGSTTVKLSDNFVSTIQEGKLPLLGDIPYIGKLLFSHNPLVYLSLIIAVVLGVFLTRTRAGLNMKAVGENPASADAAGVNVKLVKYVYILIGGGICGLGGAYISLINGGGVWNNNCVNGQGWIAVALVIFARWSPIRAIFGALVFGAFSILQFYAPKDIISLPNAFYVMLPFLITAIVLVVTSMKKSQEGSQPAATGVNYFREER